MNSRINNVPIVIAEASLSGAMAESGNVEWFIDIYCEAVDIGHLYAAPRIYSERMEWAIESIAQMTDRPLRIERGADPDYNTILPGLRQCIVYVVEHHILDRNRIEFSRDSEGNLYLLWKAETSGGVRYTVDIHVQIDFLGISMGAMTEEEAATRLRFERQGMRFYEEEGMLYLIPEDSSSSP